jgi:homoserine dehydrogenase
MSVNIALQGAGNIGRELIRRVIPLPNYWIRAIGDTSGVVASPEGFNKAQLNEIIRYKEGKGSLSDLSQYTIYSDMSEALWSLELDVLVDACNTQTYSLFDEALEYCSIVTANKAPLADVTYKEYIELLSKAEEHGRVLDYGPTAGAGMRIPNLLWELGSDGVDRFTGCLSGTMNYVSQRINEGRPISTAIREAMSPPRNYAEPDPRIDLGGEDFVRKLVIVARICGVQMERDMVEVKNIIPPKLAELPMDEFVDRLQEMDPPTREMISDANRLGRISWYLGTADLIEDIYTVGFEEVPMGDPIGLCKESDNVLKLFPSRWRRPVTIMGPGAGPPETVTGLLTGLGNVEKNLG